MEDDLAPQGAEEILLNKLWKSRARRSSASASQTPRVLPFSSTPN